jgi:hypothetical protein
VETLEVNSVQNKWSYIVPLTLGSIYIFKFHEIAWTGTVTAGTSNLFRGYSSGGGSVPAVGSISPANTIATRTGWSVVTFGTTGGEEVMLELKGPAGSTDPGLNFICGFTVSAAGIGTKKVNDPYSYTWNNTTKVAQWVWEDTTQLVNGSAYTLTLG